MEMHRRQFLAALAAAGFAPRFVTAAQTLQVKYRKAAPYAAQTKLVDAANDVFECEKRAALIEGHHARLLATRTLPLSPDLSPDNFQPEMDAWLASLGEVREARFFALPDNLVRYEVSSHNAEGLMYRVGTWRETWQAGKLSHFAWVSESLVRAPVPLFRDVTGHAFGNMASFEDQLRKGNPYWRARLDVAAGIDIFGSNGIAVGDIDGDGRDEIYICQPGGLPNRLYRALPNGTLEDISDHAGVAILDDTTCALFIDLRNTGHQDLVVLRGSGPLLFLNDGSGKFRIAENAFRFATPPQGSFTCMAGADYDRDGRVDLYLCCYVYFQSEDQYRYPTPYFDARNGPPNFLFRNRLTSEGGGFFEDVTEPSGMNHNNDRYSFAPAWCDFDGDGWPDLFVANDFGAKNLYRNCKGKFRDEAAELGVTDVGPGMSASWFDYDGDGRPDLYVSNMWSAPGQRITRDPAFNAELPLDAYRRHAKGNSLFRNTGDRFEEGDGPKNVSMGRWAWSSGGFDFDNDGVPEIFVTCGMLTNSSTTDLNSFFWRQVVAQSPPKAGPAPRYENGWNALNQMIREDKSWSGREPNVFYVRPPGASHYVDYSGVSGLDFADDSRSFAVLDLDGDGNLDIVLKSRLGPQVRVLQNCCGTKGNSLVIRLRGTKSNRDAIGARVRVNRQVKFLEAGSGYLSQHTKDLHFGLGDAAVADVHVTWPSGLEQSFGRVPTGFRYAALEGEDRLVSTPLAKRREWPSSAVAGQNDPISASTWLLEPVPLPDRRKGPGFLLLTFGETAAPAGVPVEVVDLSAAPDLAAAYSIFRRYLFDLRTELTLPALFLIDSESRAHRIYAGIPEAGVLRADLARMGDPKLALPFAGDYYRQPSRNYYKLGAAFYQEGYPEQALPYLYETTRRAPDNWKAWMATGQLHADASRNREALDAFNKVIELQPRRSAALLYAGECEAKLGQASRAESLIRRALDADATNADAANQLGLLMAQSDRPEEARKYFEQTIAMQRDHNLAINNLGVLYMKQGKVNDAIAAFQYGIGVAPDDDMLYLNLGRVYVSTGDREKARALMQRLLDRKPGDAAALHALEELNSR